MKKHISTIVWYYTRNQFLLYISGTKYCMSVLHSELLYLSPWLVTHSQGWTVTAHADTCLLRVLARAWPNMITNRTHYCNYYSLVLYYKNIIGTSLHTTDHDRSAPVLSERGKDHVQTCTYIYRAAWYILRCYSMPWQLQGKKKWDISNWEKKWSISRLAANLVCSLYITAA